MEWFQWLTLTHSFLRSFAALETISVQLPVVFKSVVGKRTSKTTHAQSNCGLAYSGKVVLPSQVEDWISLCVLSQFYANISSHCKSEFCFKGQRWKVQ